MKRGRETEKNGERKRETFDIEGKREGGGGTSDRLFYNQNNYALDFSTYNNNYIVLYILKLLHLFKARQYNQTEQLFIQ